MSGPRIVTSTDTVTSQVNPERAYSMVFHPHALKDLVSLTLSRGLVHVLKLHSRSSWATRTAMSDCGTPPMLVKKVKTVKRTKASSGTGRTTQGLYRCCALLPTTRCT